MTPIVIFAPPGEEDLGQGLAVHLAASVGRLEIRNFPDGETYVRVDTSVANTDVIIASSLDRPNPKIFPLIQLASALRASGARRIILAAPYLAYMRQDRAFREGEAVSARIFARLLSGYIDGLVTVDPHLHRIHDLGALFGAPVRVVAAAPALSAWISEYVERPGLVGPDSESEQWVSEVAEQARCPFVVLEKVRRGDHDVEARLAGIEMLRDRTPVLVDDIISTAQTMIAAAKEAGRVGLRAPICVGVHAIFSDSALEDLQAAGVARIVTCNTVRHASNAIDVRPLIAGAVRDFLEGSAR